MPAIYDKVKLNSIASGKAEMLKPQVALDQPLEVSKDRKLNRYLSANTAVYGAGKKTSRNNIYKENLTLNTLEPDKRLAKPS